MIMIFSGIFLQNTVSLIQGRTSQKTYLRGSTCLERSTFLRGPPTSDMETRTALKQQQIDLYSLQKNGMTQFDSLQIQKSTIWLLFQAYACNLYIFSCYFSGGAQAHSSHRMMNKLTDDCRWEYNHRMAISVWDFEGVCITLRRICMFVCQNLEVRTLSDKLPILIIFTVSQIDILKVCDNQVSFMLSWIDLC